MIYDEDDPSDCVYRVERGCVRLQVSSRDGSRQIAQFVLPGEIFGICPRFRHTAAEALSEVILLRYSLKTISDATFASAAISTELLEGSTLAYRELAHRTAMIVHQPAMARVADFYDWLGRKMGIEDSTRLSKLPISQRDIADYLGLAPETVSRCLHQLRAKRHGTLKPAAAKKMSVAGTAAVLDFRLAPSQRQSRGNPQTASALAI